MLRAVYVLFGLIVIGGYGYAAWNGLELRSTKKQLSPQGARSTQGGGVVYYRGGYRGGK
jgi:hypothetical protein